MTRVSHRQPLTRRQFVAATGGVVGSAFVWAGCAPTAGEALQSGGRLTARPTGGIQTSVEGTRTLALDAARDAILRMPAKVGSPVALLVILHGAGGAATRVLDRFGQAADAAGVALLAPYSRTSTWDAIRGDYGRDVAFLDRALARTFELVAVDPTRLAIGGFSDGATYALSLGLINGDLFRRVVAFSPGFVVPGGIAGKPKFFVSHGLRDDILPIDRCSRVIVPALQRLQYEVTFREFDGGHEVPAAIAAEGLAWVADGR